MSYVLFRHHPPRRQNRTGVTFLASLNRRSRDESDFSFPPLELEGLRPALASYLRIALHTSAAAAARRADVGSVPTRTMDPCRRDDDGSIVVPGGGLLLLTPGSSPLLLVCNKPPFGRKPSRILQ